MATRKVNTSSSPVAARSTTAAASRRARKSGGPVRVWSEASVTVSVTDDPPQFIKFTHGFEAMSPSDSDEDLRRTERRIYETCEKIVDMRVRKLKRMMRR